MFTDIRREHHRSLRHGKLDHISLMEILYADDTLLITKNARAMNRLLHAVEDDSQYCGLNPNKSKCAVIEWASARVPPTPLLGGWAGGTSTVDVHPHGAWQRRWKVKGRVHKFWW